MWIWMNNTIWISKTKGSLYWCRCEEKSKFVLNAYLRSRTHVYLSSSGWVVAWLAGQWRHSTSQFYFVRWSGVWSGPRQTGSPRSVIEAGVIMMKTGEWGEIERLRTEPASPFLHVGHQICLRLSSSTADQRLALLTFLCVSVVGLF